MDFDDYLISAREKIISQLSQYCNAKRNDSLPPLLKEQKFIDSLEEFALRGKLLRGVLFLFTVEALGKRLESYHLDIACAIEFLHSALLIQDDIIDNDYERRGIETIFAKYEEIGKKIGAKNNYHYGISSAIVVADIAFFYAIDLISNCKKLLLPKVLKYYSDEVYKVVLAEGVDSVFGQTDKEPSQDDIEKVYLYKTARYTFSLPFELGVIVSGGDKSSQEKFSKLGELMGIIFQIKDDELGIFGNDEIGKPVGSDIRENKKTLIRSFLYQKSSPSDKKFLDSAFGNPELSSEQILRIQQLYFDYKIKKMIDSRLEQIGSEIERISKMLPLNERYMLILKKLIEFNVNRTK